MSRYTADQIRAEAELLKLAFPNGSAHEMMRDYADIEKALAKLCRSLHPDSIGGKLLQSAGLWRDPLPQEPSGEEP